MSTSRKFGVGHPYSVFSALVTLMFFSATLLELSRYSFLGDLESGWYLLFMLSFSLDFISFPLKKVRPNNEIRGLLLNRPTHKFLMIVPIVFSFLYLIPFAVSGLVVGSLETRANLYAEVKIYLLPDSIFTTLAVAGAMFHPLFVVQYFKADLKGRGFSLIYFIGGFINPVLLALCFMERDVFIFLPLLVYYVVFSLGIVLSRGVKLVFGALILLFIIISVGRFYQEGELSYLLYGTLGYIGQQPLVFIDIIQEHTNFYGLARRLPVLSNLFSLDADYSFENSREWHFGTIMADMYMMYGWISYIAGLIIIRLMGNYVIAGKTYERYILSLIYVQLVFQGLFYFNLGNRAGNGYILLMILVYGVFKFRKWRRFQL